MKPAPSICVGAVAVQVVELPVPPVAGSVPTRIVVPPVAVLKFVPVTVTTLPPVAGPPPGDTLDIDGKTAYVYADASAPVTPPTVTVMSTVPVPAGLETVHDVLSSQNFTLPVAEPNSTLIEGARPTPVKVTSWPPVVGPTGGLTPVIAGATYWN